MEYYNGRYRPLVFFVYIATKMPCHVALVQRLRAVNGDNPVNEDAEIVNATRFKEGGKGLAPADVKEFLQWFLNSNLTVVSSVSNIAEKLKMLRMKRLAKLHVECPDGPISQKRSMPYTVKRRAPISSLPQGTRPRWKNC